MRAVLGCGLNRVVQLHPTKRQAQLRGLRCCSPTLSVAVRWRPAVFAPTASPPAAPAAACTSLLSLPSVRHFCCRLRNKRVHTTEARWLLHTDTKQHTKKKRTACVARLLLLRDQQECVDQESLTKAEQRLGLDCWPPAGTALSDTQHNSSSRYLAESEPGRLLRLSKVLMRCHMPGGPLRCPETHLCTKKCHLSVLLVGWCVFLRSRCLALDQCRML